MTSYSTYLQLRRGKSIFWLRSPGTDAKSPHLQRYYKYAPDFGDPHSMNVSASSSAPLPARRPPPSCSRNVPGLFYPQWWRILLPDGVLWSCVAARWPLSLAARAQGLAERPRVGALGEAADGHQAAVVAAVVVPLPSLLEGWEGGGKMGARGRVREETGRGGRRGRGRKLDKPGLYPRARVSRFRLPPGGHHRGAPSGPLTAGALHRGRGMAAPPQPPPPPPPPPVSGQGLEGAGDGWGGGVWRWGGVGRGSPKSKENGCSGTWRPGLSFLARGAFYSGGPALRLQPQARLHATSHAAAAAAVAAACLGPRRRRRPASPGGSPMRAAALRPGADGKTPVRSAAGAGADQCMWVRARAGVGWGGPAAERARVQPGPERAPPGLRRQLAELLVESRKTWGRCWREKENLREEEKPNLIFGMEMGFFFASSKQVKKSVNIIPLLDKWGLLSPWWKELNEVRG